MSRILSTSIVCVFVLISSACFGERVRVENDMQGHFDRNRDGFLTDGEIGAFKEFMHIREKIAHLHKMAQEGQDKVNQMRAEAEELENRLKHQMAEASQDDPRRKLEEAEKRIHAVLQLKHQLSEPRHHHQRQEFEAFEKLIRLMLQEAGHCEREGMEREAQKCREQAEKMARDLHAHHREMQEKELAGIKERVVHLREMSNQAEKKGDIDKAKHLWRQSEELHEEFERRIERRGFEDRMGKMHERLEETMRAIEHAKRQGNGDRSDDLHAEAEELEREIDRLAREDQLEGMEKEIRHLHELAGREEELGHDEKARAIAGEAEELKRHLLEIIEERWDHEDEDEEDCDEDDDDIEELQEQIEELRGEVEELREIVEELGEKLSRR